MHAGNERAFISTYQDMGYIKDGKMVILSPQQRVKMYKPDFKTGSNTPITGSESLINGAISWHQAASFQFKTGRYKRVK